MVRTPGRTLSLSEFLRLPQTKPASEYIDGQALQKPMPQGKHSIIQGELVGAINAALRISGAAWAFPELRCTFGGRSIVPDIVVFIRARVPLDERAEVANLFDAAPDWTIEILSPDQSQTRVTGNILHCLNHGTRLGWLIDPEERSVLVYPPGRQPELLVAPSDRLPVPELASPLQLSVADVFGWLRLVV